MPRPAGSPNRNKRGLKSQLKQEYGDDFDVIMMMGKNCKTLHDIALNHIDGEVTKGLHQVIDASNSAQAANTALEKLAQFIEPKLKAIEVEGKLDIVAHEDWINKLNE